MDCVNRYTNLEEKQQIEVSKTKVTHLLKLNMAKVMKVNLHHNIPKCDTIGLYLVKNILWTVLIGIGVYVRYCKSAVFRRLDAAKQKPKHTLPLKNCFQ